MKDNEENENLEKKLEECEKQRNEYLAGWQRARADFLNYKKEEMERVKSMIKYEQEEFFMEVLPILDNFEIIEKKLADNLKSNDNVKGVIQIKNQILNLLKHYDIEEIKAIDEKFDPNLHEAVEEVKKEGLQSGMIIEEIQKGYMMNGKILRPAQVKVVK